MLLRPGAQSPPTRDQAQLLQEAPLRLPRLRMRLCQPKKRREKAARGQGGACGRARAQQARVAACLPVGEAPLQPVLWFVPVGPGPSDCWVGGDPHLRKTCLCGRSLG